MNAAYDAHYHALFSELVDRFGPLDTEAEAVRGDVGFGAGGPVALRTRKTDSLYVS